MATQPIDYRLAKRKMQAKKTAPGNPAVTDESRRVEIWSKRCEKRYEKRLIKRLRRIQSPWSGGY